MGQSRIAAIFSLTVISADYRGGGAPPCGTIVGKIRGTDPEKSAYFALPTPSKTLIMQHMSHQGPPRGDNAHTAATGRARAWHRSSPAVR